MEETSDTRSNGYPLSTELLQEILLFADFQSFFSASWTCKVWRNAALSSYVLRRQLNTVPTLAKADIEQATPRELRLLFNCVCRKNLMAIRSNVSFSNTEEKTVRGMSDIAVQSQHGCQYAQLRGMTFILKTSTSGSHEVQLSPTIFPPSDAAALSPCGELVAVALGQKVHIYLLRESMDVRSVEGIIGDNALETIQLIEFVGDSLLRLEVDGPEGLSVKYLGYRECRCREFLPNAGITASGTQRLEYWKMGLRQVYLDSRVIEQGLGDGTSVRGVRLFDMPSRRNDNRSCSCQDEKHFFGIVYKNGTVHITQQIPSRRRSWVRGQPEAGTAESFVPSNPALRWDRFDPDNLPLAHCYDPLLAICDDGKMLVICEPPHGSAKGAVYVCSGEITYSISEGIGSSEPWPFVLSHLDLGPLDRGVYSLHISRNMYTGGYVLNAHTEHQRLQWQLQWT
ncbi:uncharacterized protein BDW70DRAFT_170051 [Aspergillus foveolatus]|uniref:uncharacterized protein n=1 Tax=Aspergillus foveolatus TaxID=210207 RepID=UPI003CCD7FEB